MNEPVKYGLFFLGGMALGSLGAVALGRGKLDFRPLAAGLLSRGLDVKDAVAEKAELIKENAEDLGGRGLGRVRSAQGGGCVSCWRSRGRGKGNRAAASLGRLSGGSCGRNAFPVSASGNASDIFFFFY